MSKNDDLPALWARRRVGESLGRLGAIASRLPGAQNLQELLDAMEQRLLAELKERLDRLPGRGGMPPAAGAAIASGEHPGRMLARLLNMQADQDHDQAIAALYRALVVELVPDEASLLAAMADGSSYPLLHVCTGRTAATRERVAENFCVLAQQSTVKLRDQVPGYIGHLRSLGLAEEGPEDREQDIRYQILEGSAVVRQIAADLKTAGSTPRYLRRVLHISPLGQALWTFCQPEKYIDA